MSEPDPAGWVVALALAGSFVLGAVNPAVIVTRRRGADVHSRGSGNPGATNVGRILGPAWGVAIAVIDVLKGFVPVWLIDRLGWPPSAALWCGLAVVVGHMFSPFLGGRGGKGVATSLGVILAVEPVYAGVGIVVLVVALPFVRRMGLASVAAALALVGLGIARSVGVPLPGSAREGLWLAAIGALVIWRHRGNLAAAAVAVASRKSAL